MTSSDNLSNWNLRTQVFNALENAGVTIDGLKQIDQFRLRGIYNLGKIGVAELVEEALVHGITIPTRRWKHDDQPVTVSPVPPDPDPAFLERVSQLEKRVAELEALLWGRVAA